MKLRALSTLQLAFGLSVAVHAAVLTLRFVDPQGFNRMFEDTPLEVVLVNARPQDRPDKAQAIAQAALAGGGEAERGRASSPLPAAHITEHSDALEQQTRQQVQSLMQQQTVLLTQIRQQIASLPRPDPSQPADSPGQIEQENKRRQLIELLAEIERTINEQNARPKKRYVSPSTREEVYALYYDRLRRAIEDKGTDNFPENNGRKLYGELTMTVTVNHDGQVLATEVVESSGNPALDRRAQAIARSAGPFGAFSSAMRREADQIVVVSRFRFTRDETLQTRVMSR